MAGGKLSNILVYEWEAWKGFLISHLMADYCHISASYTDTPAYIERFLSPNIKAFLWQINLSKQHAYPPARVAIITYLEQCGIKVLNAKVTDITKSGLHQLLSSVGIQSTRATSDIDPDAPLFVKSNLNWGGEVEQRLPTQINKRLFGDQPRAITAFDQYYITTKAKLDTAAWQDDSIVIERYISNQDDSFYRVYGFGEALVVVKAHSHSVIKKIAGDQRDKNLYIYKSDLKKPDTELPDNLKTLLDKFTSRVAIDYFCLDIVHDTKNFYIVDFNTTPYSGTEPQTSSACDHLMQGARELVR